MDDLDDIMWLGDAIQKLCDATARIAVIDAQERTPERNQERATQVCRQAHARCMVTEVMIRLTKVL